MTARIKKLEPIPSVIHLNSSALSLTSITEGSTVKLPVELNDSTKLRKNRIKAELKEKYLPRPSHDQRIN
jgi:hypothetical protein